MRNKGNLQFMGVLAFVLFSFFSFVDQSPEHPLEAPKTEVAKSTWKQARPTIHFYTDILRAGNKGNSNFFTRYEVGNLSLYHNLSTKTQFDHTSRYIQNFKCFEIVSIHRASLNAEEDMEDIILG